MWPPAPDERSELSRLQQGDENAFNLLFERYRDRLYHYIYRITKSKETAEETVMDVFLKLWHGREMATEINNLEDFLFRIARNKAIDFLRAAKRSPIIQQEIWIALGQLGTEAADSRLMKDNVASVIREATGQLSPQRRKVFQLRHEEGLSYSQMAERLNLSENTIRNHLAASVEFIRKFLVKNELLIFITLTLFGKKL